MDMLGLIVDRDSKFGEEINIEIIHPDWILFGDKMVCNTSQKKDGHKAGTKYIVGINQVPQTKCVTTDHRFTLLPLTAASEDPMICIIIFQGKASEVSTAWASGIDIKLEPVRDSRGNIEVSESNFGKGKYFPGGPTCTFRGVDIPCATYITEGGNLR
jgi:hypothetical protein